MSVKFVDEHKNSRTTEEYEQALNAVQKEFVSASISPMMIHYVVIIDALKELIYIRKVNEKEM